MAWLGDDVIVLLAKLVRSLAEGSSRLEVTLVLGQVSSHSSAETENLNYCQV